MTDDRFIHALPAGEPVDMHIGESVDGSPPEEGDVTPIASAEYGDGLWRIDAVLHQCADDTGAPMWLVRATPMMEYACPCGGRDPNCDDLN